MSAVIGITVPIESNYDKELGAPYCANKARGAVKQMWIRGELPSEKSLPGADFKITSD